MTDETKVPPIEEGEILTLTCISMGKKGDGVFKHQNFVIMVPNTEEEQEYKIKVTRVLPTVGFGIVVEEE